MITLAFAVTMFMYLGRCCCVQSRYRKLVGVVNREDDPLISMVEVHEQLPPQRWVAKHTIKNKIHIRFYNLL